MIDSRALAVDPIVGRADARGSRARARLATWFRERGSVLIGFSGGVDSAYLACVAVDALGAGACARGHRAKRVVSRGAVGARAEVAEQFGVPVLEVSTDEVSDPRYAANPSNRCYFCKTELWDTLAPIAASAGSRSSSTARTRTISATIDRAHARQRSTRVRSPLAELGFTKPAIRRLSRARGIPDVVAAVVTVSVVADPVRHAGHARPASSDRARRARAQRDSGVTGDLRVRYHGDLARVEIASDALDAWLRPTGRAAVLTRRVRDAGFDRVAVDARGFRSGSLERAGRRRCGTARARAFARGRGDAAALAADLARRRHAGATWRPAIVSRSFDARTLHDAERLVRTRDARCSGRMPREATASRTSRSTWSSVGATMRLFIAVNLPPATRDAHLRRRSATARGD